jgi:hypothetical protein
VVAATVVAMGSLGPFRFREVYGSFLYRHLSIYGPFYVTPHALLHVLSFGALGVFASCISEQWNLRAPALGGVLVLGLAIEWLQSRTHPKNPFETWDLRNDLFGVCLGLVLVLGWFVIRKQPKSMFTP